MDTRTVFNPGSEVQRILVAEQLSVTYQAPSRPVHAVREASFSVGQGEVVGLVGESGCGKSTLASAITRSLPGSSVTRGTLTFAGVDLCSAGREQLRSIRGAQIGTIPQEPRLALNPVIRAGQQIVEVLRAHRDWPARVCADHARGWLARVGLAEERYYRAYPHQLSGGQLQRVAIAMALACGPSLVIADEPTASLDTVSQAEILRLLIALKCSSRTAFLVITHDPLTLSGLADRVLVMYAGQIIESGTVASLFWSPLHPYTKALLASATVARQDRGLFSIPGEPPNPALQPKGCSFAPRCPDRREGCVSREPQFRFVDASRGAKCVLYGE